MSFGPFRLVPARKLLLEGDSPVRLGSRALDILVVLAERAGKLVSKEELIARAWPDTVVDDGSLRVHVAALRKVLGDGQDGRRYIANVPGRGYQFVAPVVFSGTETAAPPSAPASAPSLPAPLARMVGRKETVAALVAQLPKRRFVTMVGPGGIGKTTVALAVADALASIYENGVRFVDLAPLADPQLVPSALAAALELPIRSENPLPVLVGFLRDKRMLLVLDSCEHVIDNAAALAEEVFRGAPGINILATSREPLRVEGEHVHRLPPLGVPPVTDGLTAAAALRFPAVQLFVERATAILDTFELTDMNAGLIAEICRRLDGIALAIELAAGRVDAFGVAGVAERLNDRFQILLRGRRTALPRHRTLTATLDWSHDLLPEVERTVLHRLSVFAGPFDMPSAISVASDSVTSEAEVADALANLVAKSLVSAQVEGSVAQYRLLDSTRAYALERLAQSGKLDEFARRHAEHYRAQFARAEAEWDKMPAAEWLAAYRPCLGNLRVALDWASSPTGDRGLGVALMVSAVPLWFQLSLIDECRGRVQWALATLLQGESGLGEPQANKRLEMKLQAALGWSLMYTSVPARETGDAWTTALTLAEALDDTDYRLRSLWGLWAGHMNNGAFRTALELARQFRSLAAGSGDPADKLVGERMTGAALHFLGDQPGARRHIERMLSRYNPAVHGAHVVRFQFDQRVTAGITLARVLWLQGLPDQALRTVARGIDEALSIDHTLSLCNALVQAACPVALMAGDMTAAERYIALLQVNTTRHGLDVWRAYCTGFEGQLLIQRGELEAGLPLLQSTVDGLRQARFVQYHTAFLGALAETLLAAGQLQPAQNAIDEALAQCERSDERWGIPELLRIAAEIKLRGDPSFGPARMQELFQDSLDAARQQGALSWELRAALGFARMLRSQTREDEAFQLLAAVYDQFTEGLETADLRAARSLLAELSQ